LKTREAAIAVGGSKICRLARLSARLSFGCSVVILYTSR
jgi:hypothetical protein